MDKKRSYYRVAVELWAGRRRHLLVVGLVVTCFAILWIVGRGAWNRQQSSQEHSTVAKDRQSHTKGSTAWHSPVKDATEGSGKGSDSLRDGIIRELTAEAQLQEDALGVKGRISVDEQQQRRLANVGKEDVHVLVGNLANLDDNQFAMTLSADGFYYGDPEDEMLRIAHLLRTRRLLDEGQRAPDAVIPVLRQTLRDAVNKWPDARAARVRDWEEHPNGFTEEGPADYQKTSVRAMVATYLLAELQDRESISLLAELYTKQHQWLREYKPYPALPVPVPPAMNLYALHVLISKYPRDRMSPGALSAADAYATWAATRVRPIERRSVTPWNSRLDSTDPAVKLVDPEHAILRSSARPANISIYPTLFADGKPIQGATNSAPTTEGTIWFEKLSDVIEELGK